MCRPPLGALDNGGLDAGQRTAHGPGLDVHGSEIGDHDPARLGLPPVVVDRQPQGLLSPHHCFRVQRLADARNEAERGEVKLPGQVRAGSHQHADRSRRRIPDADFLPLERAVPALGVELFLIGNHRAAESERSNDAIGRSCHPSWIGRAPENILGSQVEGEVRGCAVCDDSGMYVHCAFRAARRAAREVQYCESFRIGRRDLEVRRRRRNQRVEIVAPHAPVYEDHVLQERKLAPNWRDFALVEPWGRDEHRGLRNEHARLHRCRSESREQRAEDGAVLPGPKRRKVEFRHAPEEGENALAWAYSERLQRVGETVAEFRELAVAVILDRLFLGDPS